MILQDHDLERNPVVDLIVAGGGPAGISVAQRVAQAGFRVAVVDPNPLGPWPNNYGVWYDEFEAMGLEECLECVWPKARVYLNNGPTGERYVFIDWAGQHPA
jgi:lycopene beta-cyclase